MAKTIDKTTEARKPRSANRNRVMEAFVLILPKLNNDVAATKALVDELIKADLI